MSEIGVKANKTGLICAAIGNKDIASALSAAREVASSCDLIEIRLDSLVQPQVEPFLTELATPLLFTCRPLWEGGDFDGDEAERIQLLLTAVQLKATYVDLELRAPESSFQQLQKALEGSDTQLIISSHDFTATPSHKELVARLREMKNRGADIAKIITTANDREDVLRILALQDEADQLNLPLIAFSMGEFGSISRVATVALGGFMTYCAAAENEVTAPGQMSVTTMHEMLSKLSLR